MTMTDTNNTTMKNIYNMKMKNINSMTVKNIKNITNKRSQYNVVWPVFSWKIQLKPKLSTIDNSPTEVGEPDLHNLFCQEGRQLVNE